MKRAPFFHRVALPIALLAAWPLAFGTSCKPKASAADAGAAEAPFVVNDAAESILFTWIDERGDFHVEQRAKDVPLVGRDSVRVVDPGHDEGTHGDRIFVADLRTARPDGSYPTHAMSRADFDGLALARRKEHGLTLAGDPDAAAALVPSSRPPDDSERPPSDPAVRPLVVIYGASWCGACHQAAAYLKKKGVPFVEKDIEADANADREMNAKLARAHLRGGSIPVLDVRGKVMVGFEPHEVDAALGQLL